MRFIVVAAGLLVLLGGLAGVKFAQIKTLITFGKAAAAAGPIPEVVATTEAREEVWENRLYSVGTIAPAQGVTVSSEMPGTVQTIRFESGAKVKEGQVLVELDRRVETAELASAQSRLQLARATAERTRAMFKGHAVSQAQVDADESALQSAEANVAALQAQIARKVVRAPFAGRLGIRMVNVGQYLTPGTPITELQSTERQYVDFTLPQQQIDQLRVGMLVRINPGKPGIHGEAAIAAIEPLVDPVARAGRVRAALSTVDQAVSPGMFVNVEVVLPEKRKVTVVGTTAIVHASFGDSVFVIEEQRSKDAAAGAKASLLARQQFVKTGETRGDLVEILEGVAAGEQVVSQGAFKLRNGAAVTINNAVGLDPQVEPHVENR